MSKYFLGSTIPSERITKPEEMLNHFNDWLENPFTKFFHASLDERMTNNINALVDENGKEDFLRIQGAAREVAAIINLPDLLAAELQDMVNDQEDARAYAEEEPE